MEPIIREVSALDDAQRHALEHMIGRPLRENQRLVIRVESAEQPQAELLSIGAGHLPQWCDVYAGLADEEIADLEKSIVRASDSRSFD